MKKRFVFLLLLGLLLLGLIGCVESAGIKNPFGTGIDSNIGSGEKQVTPIPTTTAVPSPTAMPTDLPIPTVLPTSLPNTTLEEEVIQTGYPHCGTSSFFRSEKYGKNKLIPWGQLPPIDAITNTWRWEFYCGGSIESPQWVSVLAINANTELKCKFATWTHVQAAKYVHPCEESLARIKNGATFPLPEESP